MTIKTKNFPANTTFDVILGKRGDLAERGILVETLETGKGGKFKASFDIPRKLRGQEDIAIRLESQSRQPVSRHPLKQIAPEPVFE